MRFFNTAGPVNCARHYCLAPLERVNLGEMLSLIRQEKYFVLHAPRQTGKTSMLLALMAHLNASGGYRTLYVNFEVAQGYRERVNEGLTALLQEISGQARWALGDPTAEVIARDLIGLGAPSLSEFLNRWCSGSPLPTVLLIDEIDALVGDVLITVLRQLRAGYPHRPAAFPQSVILCGVRDVRDYRIHSDQQQAIITGGSAFNIKAESLRLGDFSRGETERLLQQHTTETGQVFELDALALVWDLTSGQPWLVNALAYETCFRRAASRDRTQPITAEMIEEAKENLILRRETHLDQLTDKLREERVRRVIEPMLRGADMEALVGQDDIQYVADLGLIRRTAMGLQVANRIYGEIIPRELTFVTQLNFESTVRQDWYLGPDGRLEMSKLLAAFQQFFREHSESWIPRFDYHEAGPQLLLQAFLQRIVNGGGRVEREYGLGRRRTDLLVIWPAGDGGAGERGGGGAGEQVRNTWPTPQALGLQSAIRNSQSAIQRAVIELKILYKSLDQTLADGLPQTWDYADRCGADEAHLVIFDRTPGKSWDERIWRRQETWQGREIVVWGM